MSKRRFLLANAVVVFLVAGSLFCIVADREYWPFSQYPMYSEITGEHSFSGMRLYGVAREEPHQEVSRLTSSYLTFALVFFAAGVSKLRHSGLEWIFSDNMTIMLIKAHYLFGSLVPWGLDLAEHGLLTRLLAAATIMLEVGYLSALFSRRARWVIVPGVFLLQVGITVLMGPGFYQYLICNLFWIPWDRVSRQFVHGFQKLLPLRERKKLNA